MASVYTKIINGEIPSYKIYEDENTIAFLDIQPFTKGHTLVVPKIEIDKFYDLPLKNYQLLMDTVYRLSPAIEKAVPCKRVGLLVLGLEVPHAHIHLVPINSEDDINIHNRMQLKSEEFLSIAKIIKSFL